MCIASPHAGKYTLLRRYSGGNSSCAVQSRPTVFCYSTQRLTKQAMRTPTTIEAGGVKTW